MVISLVHHSLVVTMVIINVQQQFGATFIYDADPPTGGEKKRKMNIVTSIDQFW